MSRLFTLALLLAIGLSALPAGAAAPASFAAPAPAGAPGAANPDFMGMVIRDPYYDFGTNPQFPGQPNYASEDKMGEILAAAGVRWVRLDFLADPDGHVNFAKYDYFIGTVAPRHGFKVLGLLGVATIRTWVPFGSQGIYYPYLLNAAPTDLPEHPIYGYGLNQYMVDWLDEALRVAAHYDGSNPQAGRVHAFEIFNEVNRLFGDGTNLPDGKLLPPPYAPITYAGLNPAYVARIQAKFYRVCKNTDGLHSPARCPADTQIIVGGLHPKGTSKRRTPSQKETAAFTDRSYLEAMYRSAFADYKNAQGSWPVDGVGYHPYPEEIRLTLQSVYVDTGLNRMRALIDTYDPGRPFWITEVGYNIGVTVNKVFQTEAGQAAFMRDVYTSLSMWPQHDVANVFWFKFEDFPRGCDARGKPVGAVQQWGIVHIPFTECDPAYPGGSHYADDGQPSYVRLSYLAYRELAGLPIARTYLPFGAR